MRRWKWVVATNKIAQQIGLGWLVRCVGFVALAVLWIISIPLMLAYYFSPYRLSVHTFYFDQLYQWTIVLPLRALARLCSAVDRWLVDATVDWIARVPVWVGNIMRSLQMGVISFYALSMLLGAVILLLVRLMWGA
jgi:NADH-quinone oxidoreductase subunit L